MTEATATAPKLYTVSEVSEFTRSSPASIRRMVREGLLDGVRWGIEIRIPHDSLMRYVEAHPAKLPAAARHPGRNGRKPGRPRKTATA